MLTKFAGAPRLALFCGGVALGLISCNPDCNSDQAWKQQLFKEVRVGNLPSVEALLSSKDCPDVAYESGKTPLMVAAANGHYGVAKLLLKHGAKIDLKEGAGYTALMFASAACEPSLVRLLVDYDAYIPMRNYAGDTSFDLAKRRADFWSQGSEEFGVSKEQSWSLQYSGNSNESSLPPKATCAEVRDQLRKLVTGV